MFIRVQMKILVINVGSSSIKSVVIDADKGFFEVLRLNIENIGYEQSTLSLRTATTSTSRNVECNNHQQAIGVILNELQTRPEGLEIGVVGHRVVFGGPNLREPVLYDQRIRNELENYIDFDSEHLPFSLEVLDEVTKHLANCPQVLCFDTGFFSDLPRASKILPLPREYESFGVIRYGYHGLSYEYITSRLLEIGVDVAKKKIVLAHLGSGASLAAIVNGSPIDTTMSFSPSSGIPMSTRSGNIDPQVAAYMMATKGLSVGDFRAVINKDSGLKGVSGISGDMLQLLNIMHDSAPAKDAVEMFCYEVKKTIGSFTAAMGGLDELVFTGGIGEKSAPIRQIICQNLSFLGIKLDRSANKQSLEKISLPGTINVRVIKTNEELMIATKALKVLKN